MADRDSAVPLGVFDFFAYVASGTMLLVGVAFAFDFEIGREDGLSIAEAGWWLVLSYSVGQCIAHFSGLLLKDWLIHRVVGMPSDHLLKRQAQVPRRWKAQALLSRCVPSYVKPLGDDVLARLEVRLRTANVEPLGGDAFYYARSVVRRDSKVWSKLEFFLERYMFCRNTALAMGVASMAMVGGLIFSARWSKLAFAFLLLLGSLVLIGRYLKFFHRFALEVLSEYSVSGLEASREHADANSS